MKQLRIAVGGVIIALAALFAGSFVFAVGLTCDGSSDATPGTGPRATAVPTTGGPSAQLEPKGGPPGTEITVSGSGWPAGTQITLTAVSPDARPYATVVTDKAGNFRARFTLEKQPDGSALETGRFDIIAEAGSARVSLAFLVEVRRPLSGPGPGGG